MEYYIHWLINFLNHKDGRSGIDGKVIKIYITYLLIYEVSEVCSSVVLIIRVAYG